MQLLNTKSCTWVFPAEGPAHDMPSAALAATGTLPGVPRTSTPIPGGFPWHQRTHELHAFLQHCNNAGVDSTRRDQCA